MKISSVVDDEFIDVISDASNGEESGRIYLSFDSNTLVVVKGDSDRRDDRKLSAVDRFCRITGPRDVP